MTAKMEAHIFSGMNKDMAVSKSKPEFLYDAHNIRFTAIEDGTLLTMTNEKGPLYQEALTGNYLGHCTFNDCAVVFTKSKAQDATDYIYKVSFDDKLNKWAAKELFKGNLNFSLNNKIETLGSYEKEDVKKVYWVDGLNQPRVINAAPEDEYTYDGEGVCTLFDFVPTLELKEEISVTRNEGSGMFAPGVIQYAFAYYNLYGQESNIFYTTPLNYVSYIDRGAAGDDKIANTFTIKITGVDKHFDFLRIFSIHRTTYEATPTCKRVVDLEVDGDTLTFVDDGTKGDIIDDSQLFYIGGEDIVVNTMTQKDNTLFLGNYKIERDYLNNLDLEGKAEIATTTIVDEIPKTPSNNKVYNYTNTLKYALNGFKNREHYRLGVQFQHKNGKWSSPVVLRKSFTVGSDKAFNPDSKEGKDTAVKTRLGIEATLPLDTDILKEKGYVKARPVCVFPTVLDRLVLAQGLLCPTVYGLANRAKKTIFAQSSWFFRPTIPNSLLENFSLNNTSLKSASFAEYNHNKLLPRDTLRNAEIQGAYTLRQYSTDIDDAGQYSTVAGSYVGSDAESVLFAVDQSILTFHSPDVQFDTDVQLADNQNWQMRLVGIANFTNSAWDVEIETSTAAALGPGFWRRTDISESPIENALLAAPLYADGVVCYNESRQEGKYYVDGSSGAVGYITYPWHRTGSLNNDEPRSADGGQQTAILKSKILSNLKFSADNTWFEKPEEIAITNPQLFSSDELQLLKIPYADDNLSFDSVNYCGNFDNVLNRNSLGYEVKAVHYIGDEPTNTSSIDLIKQPDQGTLREYDDFIGSTKPSGGGSGGDPNESDGSTITDNGNNNSGGNNNNNPGGNNEDNLEDTPTETDDSTASASVSTSKKNILIADKVAVRMRYKSDKHFVLSLKAENHKPVILPSLNGNGVDGSDVTRVPYWLADEPNVRRQYAVHIDYIINLHPNLLKQKYEEALNNQEIDEASYPWIFNLPTDVTSTNLDEYEGKIVLQYNVRPYRVYVLRVNHNPKESGKPESEITWYEASTYNQYFVADEDTNLDIVPREDLYPIKYVYFKGISGNQVDLDTKSETELMSEFTEKRLFKAKQDSIDITPEYPYLFLAELYREENPDIDFGGTNKDALQSNMWLPAGEPTDIKDEITLEYKYGDTWYQRYDCMKTYPFVKEAENSVVEIGSFMCETRINLDGRYDRNRGQISNINYTPDNFNLLNEVYKQSNNWFNYNILPDNVVSTDVFPNQVMWTLEKQAAAEIDNWTNLTPASTLDMDGTKGQVNALRTFDNTVLCFQDNAINQVLYNERVQIPVSDGVPIEISNSGKVSGKRIISDKIGCKNKWSICSTSQGVYFLDSTTKRLYTLKEGLQSVSDVKGMDIWFKSKENFDNEKTFFDFKNQDLYLIWDDTCLVYSEFLGAFTSFMNYEKTAAMFNIGDSFYALHDSGNFCNYYKMFSGYYNRIYGEHFPVEFTFVSNENSQIDKTFTNIETRTDYWIDDELQSDFVFDSMRVFNEYQDTGTVYPNAKKKFRIWRIEIPRHKDSLDRIRNTWTKTTFKLDLPRRAFITRDAVTTDVNLDAYYEADPRFNYNAKDLGVAEEAIPKFSSPTRFSIDSFNKLKLQLHDLNVQYFI